MAESDLGDARVAQGTELTDHERDLMEKILGNPLLWPDSAKTWIADYVSQNSLIPVSQIKGFTQFTAKSAAILTGSGESATTTSTTWTDLSTAGPSLDGIPPGQYLLFFGFTGVGTTSGIITYAAPSINGATPAANKVAEVFSGPGPSTGSFSAMTMFQTELTESTNTVALKYQTSGGTSFYQNCWLTILRVGNL